MAINEINGLLGALNTAEMTRAAQTTPTRTDALGREEFLRLLSAQLRFQNPMEPTSGTEFVSQLATFANLEGIERLNTSFEDLLRIQQLTTGANLIGKTITFHTGGGSATARGIVSEINIQDGRLQLMVDGTAVGLDQVVSLAGA